MARFVVCHDISAHWVGERAHRFVNSNASCAPRTLS
jgi:hypothetical protein